MTTATATAWMVHPARARRPKPSRSGRWRSASPVPTRCGSPSRRSASTSTTSTPSAVGTGCCKFEPPFVIGMAAAGTVDAAGPGCEALLGRRVVGVDGGRAGCLRVGGTARRRDAPAAPRLARRRRGDGHVLPVPAELPGPARPGTGRPRRRRARPRRRRRRRVGRRPAGQGVRRDGDRHGGNGREGRHSADRWAPTTA